MTPAEKSYQSLLDIRRALGVNTDALPQACTKPIAVLTAKDHLMLHNLGVCWSGDYRS
jgi:hypothetical protein